MNLSFRRLLTRRTLLHLGSVGGVGLTLSQFLQMTRGSDPASQGKTKRPQATADACIFVNLAGGVSHLDTLDMKPDGPSETRGEFATIDTTLTGLKACEYLPKFATIADQFCLLRGISHSAGAHPQAQSYLSTGNRPVPALLYPSLGAVTTKERAGRADMPGYVAIPDTEWNAGYMGDSFAPFKTTDVPKPGQPFGVRGISLAEGLTLDKVARRNRLLDRLNRRFRDADANSQLLEALDTFGRQANQMITSAHSQAAFDVSREPESIRNKFATDDLGQSLLLAARLVEYGVPFVTVSNSGWDTHTDNFAGHRRLIPPLDAGMHALMGTLREKGLLDRTLVVIMGEFGRTPKINENVGRDHWPRANWALFTGGGVKTGQIIGATDRGGEGPTGDVPIALDDIAASIYHALGIDFHKEYYTNTNRPVMLVPEGKVIPGLF